MSKSHFIYKANQTACYPQVVTVYNDNSVISYLNKNLLMKSTHNLRVRGYMVRPICQ